MKRIEYHAQQICKKFDHARKEQIKSDIEEFYDYKFIHSNKAVKLVKNIEELSKEFGTVEREQIKSNFFEEISNSPINVESVTGSVCSTISSSANSSTTTDSANSSTTTDSANSSTTTDSANSSTTTDSANSEYEYMSASLEPDLSAVASPPEQSLSYGDLETSEEPFGAGGQAIVYEATLTVSDSPSKVALKEPKHEQTLTTEAVESFLQEASTWQTIDRRERKKPRWSEYEHIVGIVDTGEDPYPWIAMEYMDGGDLENRLDNAPDGLPVDEALWIGERLCRGLEIADELGYSHLDVKPKNILFRQTQENKWDVPKLADWGIARTLAEQTGTMEAQTIPYSAPEQFDASEFGDPDSLTDLYQVGAVMYTMLTGEPPHTGSNRQIMHEVLENKPPLPSQHRSDLSEAIDVAVKIAMEKRKQDRFRGLQGFEKALRAVRTGSQLPEVVDSQIESSTMGGQPATTEEEASVDVPVPDQGQETTDRGAESSAEADEDTGGEPKMYQLDEEEREELESEYGADFASGNQVDPAGEADIDVPDADELAAEAEGEGEATATAEATNAEPETTDSTAEPSTTETATEESETTESTDSTGTLGSFKDTVESDGSESTADDSSESTADDSGESTADTAITDETGSEAAGRGADSETQEAADIDLEDAVVGLMGDLDDGDGVVREAIVARLADDHGVEAGAVEEAIDDALMSGRCYEPDDSTLKAI